ncbi:MAG: hypothetical protein QOI54_2551 [Actinomycetota bacterium]|nr:hypothetical protein [Actinomycetota bacterium]
MRTSAQLLGVLEAVWDQSHGLLVFDAQLRYARVNAQMAAMANPPADALLGRSLRDEPGSWPPRAARHYRRVPRRRTVESD